MHRKLHLKNYAHAISESPLLAASDGGTTQLWKLESTYGDDMMGFNVTATVFCTKPWKVAAEAEPVFVVAAASLRPRTVTAFLSPDRLSLVVRRKIIKASWPLYCH